MLSDGARTVRSWLALVMVSLSMNLLQRGVGVDEGIFSHIWPIFFFFLQTVSSFFGRLQTSPRPTLEKTQRMRWVIRSTGGTRGSSSELYFFVCLLPSILTPVERQMTILQNTMLTISLFPNWFHLSQRDQTVNLRSRLVS